MKYKVGDKVKVRSDLETDNDYENVIFVSAMEKYKGQIVEISKVNNGSYFIKGDNSYFHWTDEMFEPVEDPQDKINNDILCLFMQIRDIRGINIDYYIDRLQYDIQQKENSEKSKENLEKSKEPTEILDKVEKKYLWNMVKPFKDKVKYIGKTKSIDGQYIKIGIKRDASINLPYFLEGTMYKGMEIDKEYTLEELGLVENEV